MSLSLVLYSLFCMIAGGATSAGYVAFITLLGVFDKLTEKYKAFKYGRLIENFIILGVTCGNLIFLFNLPIPLGVIGMLFFLFMGGVFIGCLAGALAETLKVFPILSRRFSIRNYLPYILISAAAGKCVGSIIQLLLFK